MRQHVMLRDDLLPGNLCALKVGDTRLAASPMISMARHGKLQLAVVKVCVSVHQRRRYERVRLHPHLLGDGGLRVASLGPRTKGHLMT
jgi:hypothetical protein